MPNSMQKLICKPVEVESLSDLVSVLDKGQVDVVVCQGQLYWVYKHHTGDVFSTKMLISAYAVSDEKKEDEEEPEGEE